MTYASAIEWLYGIQLFGIKLGLENVRRLCEVFELSTEGMNVVHVAGTNGKGSVCAMAESLARRAGRRAGLFTSPHLVSYCERIRVNGEQISPEDTARGLNELREIVAGWDPHPTFFELSTILAVRHFAKRETDVVILETGMGGRLDATTGVAHRHFRNGGAGVSVITPIAMDHQEWLGETLAEIAAEKAGIISPGIPVVAAEQEAAAAEVLRAAAGRAGSKITFVERAWEGGAVGLEGAHQRRNAALALAALRSAGIPVTGEAERGGLEAVRWRGRFERVDAGDASDFVVDGAHNPAAAAVLAATWREVFGAARATLIFGAVRLKDAAGMLRELRPIAGRIIFCGVDSPRAVPPAELAAGFCPDGIPVFVAGSVRAAIEVAKGEGARQILVAGSLFLAGETLALLSEVPHEASAQ